MNFPLVVRHSMMLCMAWVLSMLLGMGCTERLHDSVPAAGVETVSPSDETGEPVGSPDTGTDEVIDDCDLPAGFDWTHWGSPFFRTWCSGCHGAEAPERYGAPEWLVFDTEAQVYTHRDVIRSSVLERQSMPLGGGLPTQEAASLDLFLRCAFGS